MGLARRFAVLALASALAACQASPYGDVPRHRVESVDTPEGRVLRVFSSSYLAHREVIERSPNVKSVTRMTTHEGVGEPGDFCLSPDGSSLTYEVMQDADGMLVWNLWRIGSAGGSGVTRLTAGRYVDVDPSFSSSGDSVYFASNRSSPLPKIWRVRATGAGGLTRVTAGDGVDRQPSLDPGDGQVYYTSLPSNAVTPQIWRIAANGNLPTQLREGERPRVSPDGSKILYTSVDAKSQRTEVWVMEVDGTNQTQLTSGVESHERDPSWAFGGTKILYASDAGMDSNGKKNFDIWMMDADGSNPTQLTTNGSTDMAPLASPDSKFIYFLSNRGLHWDIWRMEIVGP